MSNEVREVKTVVRSEREYALEEALYDVSVNINKAMAAINSVITSYKLDNASVLDDSDLLSIYAGIESIATMLDISTDYLTEALNQIAETDE